MSTSVSGLSSNFFPEAENGFTTTLASTISSGAATVPLNSVSGYTNGSPAVFVVDPSDITKKQTFTGIIDTAGVQVTSVVWTAGTNQAHSGGATAVDYATATHVAMIQKGLLVGHTQAGLHALGSSDTLTSSKFVTALNDTNGNELFKVTATASAVNEFTVVNAATGTNPSFTASGGDSNVSIDLIPKGTGNILKAGNKIDGYEEIKRLTLTPAGDTISLTSVPSRKYLRIQYDLIATGGTLDATIRFNNDSGANYSASLSAWDGNTNTALVSQTSIPVESGTVSSGNHESGYIDIFNVLAIEKSSAAMNIGLPVGAANAPVPTSVFGKWANTAAVISRVDFLNGGTGDFAIGSEVVIYGHD